MNRYFVTRSYLTQVDEVWQVDTDADLDDGALPMADLDDLTRRDGRMVSSSTSLDYDSELSTWVMEDREVSAWRNRGPASQPDPAAALRKIADGTVVHRFMGGCPDALEGPDVRDPDCPACAILTVTDNPGGG